MKTGNEVVGTAHEITDEYVSVHDDDEVVVILKDFIGGWETSCDAEFSGLPEDTVVEKVEFDWEDNKTKDQTDNTMVVSSSLAKSNEDNKQKIVYMCIGSGITLIVVLIAKLLNLV